MFPVNIKHYVFYDCLKKKQTNPLLLFFCIFIKFFAFNHFFHRFSTITQLKLQRIAQLSDPIQTILFEL